MRIRTRYLIASCAAILLLLTWAGWCRLAGLPWWLEHIGFTPWLKELDPIDRWAATVAAISVVFVALLQEPIKAIVLRARLNVRILDGIEISWHENNNDIAAYHFRLAATCNGLIAARFVEIHVTELWKDGVPISWSPMALRWTDGNLPYREILPLKTTRLCDFLMMLEPGPATEAWIRNRGGARSIPADFDYRSTAFIKLMTSADPNGLMNVLPPAKYTIGLELSAANAKRTEQFFDIGFDGRWTGDTSASIVIRESTRPR